MQLTSHTDFGLRVLLLLGAMAPRRLAAQDMADRYGLSHTHVQKVVQSLATAGFVQTYRGRSGGVQLSRPAADIGIGEVVRALEPHLHLVECLRPGTSSCVLDGGCALTHTLMRARAAMMAELDTCTVQSIIEGSPHVARITH